MGRLNVDMFVTLDGVAQAPGAPQEDTEGGFQHGGWQAPFLDPEAGEHITRHIQDIDALLLGRKTYDIFANHWPNAHGEIARKLNEVPKYVASRTLQGVDWQNSCLIEGDVATAIPGIKAKHDQVHAIGSTNLVQSLIEQGLVDRFNIWVYPVILGQGKRLFGTGTVPTGLRLAASKAFPGGGVLLTYDKAGKPHYGDLSQP
ncbi:MAG: dihydrofolate reductase family protein [Halobacteriales archaeon]|nr:dihydrofolate reductase family protein [Halobacteriales archaeon]